MTRQPPAHWAGRVTVVLSVVQTADAVGNLLVPRRFYTAHLDHLCVPRWLQPILPTVKLTGSAGLVLGLRHPALRVLTHAALTGYYGAAFAFHLAAGDRPIIAAPAALLAATTAITAAGSCPRSDARTLPDHKPSASIRPRR